MTIFTAPDGTVYNTANICLVSKLKYDSLNWYFEVYFINGTDIPNFSKREQAEECRKLLIEAMSGTDPEISRLKKELEITKIDNETLQQIRDHHGESIHNLNNKIEKLMAENSKLQSQTNSSWANDVDRQGGSFSDSEIRSAGCW